MRLTLVLTALAASAPLPITLAHGLRSLRSLAYTNYPQCTTPQTTEFKETLNKASSNCTANSSYVWEANADPTDAQRAALCQCPLTALSVPKCSWLKMDIYRVSVTEHVGFVYNCTNTTGYKLPTLTESGSNDSPVTAVDADCTVQQLTAFTTALNTASSGCTAKTAYNWGGNQDPTEAQYSEICKCTSIKEFTVPDCYIYKLSYRLPLTEHYNWVKSTQCPTFSPSASSTSSSKSSSKIAGIAAGVVVVLLLVGFVLFKRKRKAKQEKDAMDTTETSTDYRPMGMMPQVHVTYNLNADPRATGTTAYTTISTQDGSVQHSNNSSQGSSSSNSVRMAESTTWDDPGIVAVRIPYKSVFFGTLITRGGYGEIYKGTYKGETVAIKQLLPTRRQDLDQIAAFLGELKLMSTLEHERIVKFIGVAWNAPSDTCLVVEYMDNGDLRSVLNLWDSGPKKRACGFDADKVKIALHVAHALFYLHSLQPVVVHRDLKSKNILLNTSLDAKLADFGVSRERAESTMTAGVGSSLWMAPEVMLGKRYDEKADIFSFGVVLSELDSHQQPYLHARVTEGGQKVHEAAIMQQVMQGRTSVGFTDLADPALVQLGRECVSLDPRERPTTAKLLYRLHQVMESYQ